MIRKLLCLVFLALVTHQQQTVLPVSSELILKLALSMSKLEDALTNFGTWSENKYLIYKRVKLTKGYLDELNVVLVKYNNVVLGSGSSVNGNKNVIIGSYNNITGSNNWVFISNYTGSVNGDLLLKDWRIELDKDRLILINTRFAISYIDETKNEKLWGVFDKQRQFCSWKPKAKTQTPTKAPTPTPTPAKTATQTQTASKTSQLSANPQGVQNQATGWLSKGSYSTGYSQMGSSPMGNSPMGNSPMGFYSTTQSGPTYTNPTNFGGSSWKRGW